jgi:hypothetical protein
MSVGKKSEGVVTADLLNVARHRQRGALKK